MVWMCDQGHCALTVLIPNLPRCLFPQTPVSPTVRPNFWICVCVDREKHNRENIETLKPFLSCPTLLANV
jgi:hypothetical protein